MSAVQLSDSVGCSGTTAVAMVQSTTVLSLLFVFDFTVARPCRPGSTDVIAQSPAQLKKQPVSTLLKRALVHWAREKRAVPCLKEKQGTIKSRVQPN